MVERLGAAVLPKPKHQEALQPMPLPEEDPAYADQLPSSYTPSAVEPTAAEEPQDLQELPKPLAMPKRAAPISRLAMMQQRIRGPAAPNGAPLPMYSAGTIQRVSRRHGTTSPVCQTMHGQATQHTQTMLLSLIQNSIRRLHGRTSAHSTHILRYRWDGGRSRWNGIVAGGSSTSKTSLQAAGIGRNRSCDFVA